MDTDDLRFRNLVGKKGKEAIRYICNQVMPSGVGDAVNKGLKFFGCVAAIAVIALLLTFFFG